MPHCLQQTPTSLFLHLLLNKKELFNSSRWWFTVQCSQKKKKRLSNCTGHLSWMNEWSRYDPLMIQAVLTTQSPYRPRLLNLMQRVVRVYPVKGPCPPNAAAWGWGFRWRSSAWTASPTATPDATGRTRTECTHRNSSLRDGKGGITKNNNDIKWYQKKLLFCRFTVC